MSLPGLTGLLHGYLKYGSSWGFDPRISLKNYMRSCIIMFSKASKEARKPNFQDDNEPYNKAKLDPIIH
jgi:hypothetical protein